MKTDIEHNITAIKADRLKNIRNYWEKLKPFKDIDDVPDLPVVDKEEWENFYVPKLIELGAIAKCDLKDGCYYYGAYRNATIGKWDATEQQFGHWRMKFGWRWDTCNHFQDDNGYALFVPIREVNENEIKIEEEKGI